MRVMILYMYWAD